MNVNMLSFCIISACFYYFDLRYRCYFIALGYGRGSVNMFDGFDGFPKLKVTRRVISTFFRDGGPDLNK